MSLRGVIFDLDGTLVDSQLDFDAIRAEMGLPNGQPILEALEQMACGPDKDRCLAILRQHEQRGAHCATLMPHVEGLLEELTRCGVHQAILTRNSREAATLVLDRLGLKFAVVATREDVPPKPDPGGLLHICRLWNVPVDQVLFFGDYLFDLQAGRRAGMRTVLYAPAGLPAFADQADYVIRCFSEATPLVRELLG